jgi:hypothetical protein
MNPGCKVMSVLHLNLHLAYLANIDHLRTERNQPDQSPRIVMGVESLENGRRLKERELPCQLSLTVATADLVGAQVD